MGGPTPPKEPGKVQLLFVWLFVGGSATLLRSAFGDSFVFCVVRSVLVGFKDPFAFFFVDLLFGLGSGIGTLHHLGLDLDMNGAFVGKWDTTPAHLTTTNPNHRFE